jgi:hypothetical protein
MNRVCLGWINVRIIFNIYGKGERIIDAKKMREDAQVGHRQ